MKSTGKLVSIAFSMIIIFLTPAESALAGIHLGIHSGGVHFGYNHHHDHGYWYGHGHRGHYYQNRHFHGHGHHYGYWKNSYGYGNYYPAGKPCHQVSKYVYDDYGVQHKIGGRMCYNRYGEGYVVDGSRYRIW